MAVNFEFGVTVYNEISIFPVENIGPGAQTVTLCGTHQQSDSNVA